MFQLDRTLPAFFTAVLCFGILQGKAQEPTTEIEHLAVRTAKAGEPVRIQARVRIPEEQIRFFRVYYRSRGAASYSFVDLYRRAEDYEGEIPANEVTEAGLEYFLLLALNNGELITDPRYNAHRSPYIVEVKPAKESKPKTPAPQQGNFALILSPEPGQELAPEDVVVAISFTNPDSVDTTSVRLLIDGTDVTPEAQISRYLISWTPVARLLPGRHVVIMRMITWSGRQLPPLEFGFRIIGPEERKAPRLREFHGRVYTETRQERISLKNYTTNVLGGRASGMTGHVRFSANIYLTSLEKPDQQPRNRMLLGLYTKWLGLELGDTYPRLSELTLWGQRVRGLYGYLRLGFFNLEAAVGELTRAVEGITTRPTGPVYAGSYRVLNGDTLLILQPGTYRRRVWAVRPSFGSGKHFQIGFTFVKALDDTSSIRFGLKPKDNLVFGPDFKLVIGRGILRISGSAAFSLMTDDISGGPISKSEVDSLFKQNVPIDPTKYAKYLIVNENTVPLDPTGLTSLAYTLRATTRIWRNFFQASYRYVGPEYWTLANPFLRKNIRGLFVDDRIRLFGNQLYLNLRYDDFEDSFSDTDDLPTMRLRTFSYGLSFYPRRGLPQITLSLRNHGRTNGLTDTTLVSGGYDPRVNNSSREAVFSLSQTLRAGGRTQQITYSLSQSFRDDRYGGPLTGVSNTTHLLRWQSEVTRRLNAILNFARTNNRTGAGSYVNAFRYNLFGGGLQFSLLGGHARARIDGRRVNSSTEFRYGNVAQSGKVTQTNLTLGWDLYWGRHRAFIDAGITRVNAEGLYSEANGKYNDLFVRARYEFQW